MEYKCLKNDVKLYYYPEFDKKLTLYLDHPYYVILFLLIEMHMSDYEIEYTFKNYFNLVIDDLDDLEDIIDTIVFILSTILDFYVIDFEMYSEILNYMNKSKYYNLMEFMFPNYNFVFDHKKLTYDNIKQSIKYFFKNSHIHFITNSKKIFNLHDFSLIKKYVKRNLFFNNYTLPHKKFSYKFNINPLIGIYLDQLEYNEHYILDILGCILEKNNINCDFIWVSKKFKIMILPYCTMSVLKTFLINIYKNNFELKIDYNKLIKKKCILDIINFKHFNLNMYQQITPHDILNLCQKIFKHDNIKYIGPEKIK